jgi:hypothetical protein
MMLPRVVLAALALTVAGQAWSAEPAAAPTCNSGPQSGWKPKNAVVLHLTKQQLALKQLKTVGDCYAVYATNKVGQPVNNYYHPVTLQIVGPIPN